MINEALDLAPYRDVLARAGRVQIPGFLRSADAERLADCLRDAVPWSTFERGQPDTPPWQGPTRAQRMPEAWRRAAAGFHFVYDRYLIVEAMKAGRDTHLPVQSVLYLFNSPPFLELIRGLTGDPDLMMVGGQATRYLPGQFLRVHDDRHDDEARRFAYVLNLSRDWEPDWGGLLHFVDADGTHLDAFVPKFNSLSVFRVPARHFVGHVAPWARQPRLAITGWWHATPKTA